MSGMFNKKSDKNNSSKFAGEKQDNFDFITYNKYEKQFEKLKDRVENIKQDIVLFGVVVKQRQKDGKNGFPTINIETYTNINAGTYVSVVEIDNIVYHSISFVSSRSNFVKTYLLNFNKNLYGIKVKLTLLKFLHGEEDIGDKIKKFESIQRDVDSVYNFFNEDIEKVKELF